MLSVADFQELLFFFPPLGQPSGFQAPLSVQTLRLKLWGNHPRRSQSARTLCTLGHSAGGLLTQVCLHASHTLLIKKSAQPFLSNAQCKTVCFFNEG